MSQLLTVHDPRGYPPMVVGKRLANRPESLDGKVLYLIDCLFDNADVFMEQLRLWFAEHMPTVETRTIKPRGSWTVIFSAMFDLLIPPIRREPLRRL